MHSRRDFLRGVAAGAAGSSVVTGGLLASGPTARATDEGPCVPPPPASPTSPRAGWLVSDTEAADPAHILALQRVRPTILRWFVSWDRHHLLQPDQTDGIPAPPDWLGGPYRAFLDLCRPSAANPRGTTLIVQFLCKAPGWTGDGWPWKRPGATWARSDRWLGAMYPDRFGIGPTYGVFVRSLKDTLDTLGIDAHYGAWNEADLRGSFGQRAAVQNFVEPWDVNPFDLVRGAPYANWSGGAGTLWRELHDQLPGASMTTSGILFPDWIQRTAPIDNVAVIDVHLYDAASAPAEYVARVEDRVREWDDAAPTHARRNVVLGEAASDFGNAHTVASAAWLWQRHEALSQANGNPASPLFGRYLGMCSLSGQATPGEPSPWQLEPTDPAAAWWQYSPEYAAYT